MTSDFKSSGVVQVLVQPLEGLSVPPDCARADVADELRFFDELLKLLNPVPSRAGVLWRGQIS
jgi:hypothetical protein